MAHITDMNPIIENSQKIERQYPTRKRVKAYPERYDNYVFRKLNEMIKDTELQNDYKKWKEGRNYKTNRKITIGGKLHTKLKEKFMIELHPYGSVLFEDLISINSQEYLQETKKINNEIDAENIIIKNYNKSVYSLIEKIEKLEKWNDFIEFEGKRYGIPTILNNIHRENDCLGKILSYIETAHECRGCRDGMPFNGAYTCYCIVYDINKCDKCGFIKKTERLRR